MTDVALLDTSVAVALLVEDHEAHGACRRALKGQQLGLAGHAMFETMSVLSRLPGANRRPIAPIHEALVRSFPHTAQLSAEGAQQAARVMAERGIGGGAIYDALVAAVAEQHSLVLVTRDGRAVGTYAAMGAEIRFIR